MKISIFLMVLLALTSTSLYSNELEKNTSNYEGTTKMNQIKSVTIGLPVTNMDNAKKWYRNLLGKVEEMEPAPGVMEFRLTPTTWIQLFEVKTSQHNPTVMRFESDDIKASHELALRIAKEVTKIESVPEVVSYFDFKDPFGNALSFYQLLDR